MDLFRMMLGMGGTGTSLLGAALLIGLFWAALAHPDRIQSVLQFRIATMLLGISIVVPVVIQLFGAGAPAQPGVRPDTGMVIYAMAISPAMTMLAVILGVGSVTPRTGAANR